MEQPLVLLLEPDGAQHNHAEAVARAGFLTRSVAAENVDVADVVDQRPAVVAAELNGARSAKMLELARRFRQHPDTRVIPFVIYGHHLGPRDIEDAARAGALWLQLEPGDGEKLVAAIRGLVAASRETARDQHRPIAADDAEKPAATEM